MGTITYTVPQAGTDLNSVADPEIASALNTLKTWANGNIDTANISPTAGITFAQLAAGAGRMSLVTKTTAYAANSGELVLAGVTGAPFTVTLPAPSLNALVGVVAGASATGANPITVARHATDVINGVGLSSATSFPLGTPGAFAVLQSDGTNWFVVAGQQDSGWIQLAGGTGITYVVGTNYPASYRKRGDMVQLSGTMRNDTGGSLGNGSTWATNLPTPSSNVTMTVSISDLHSVVTATVLRGASSLTVDSTVSNTLSVELDGPAYRLL